MNILFETITTNFATRIIEYNGRKFRMHLERTSSMPCATIGSDFYHSLKIMIGDGTFQQITDAKEINSSVRHSSNCDIVAKFPILCEDFFKYIQSVY